jgi:hypothetical protein
MSLRPRFGTVTTDLIYWVCESPIRRRVAIYGAPLIAPFLLAWLSGSSMYIAFQVAAVPAVAFAISGLIRLALRRADLI